MGTGSFSFRSSGITVRDRPRTRKRAGENLPRPAVLLLQLDSNQQPFD